MRYENNTILNKNGVIDTAYACILCITGSALQVFSVTSHNYKVTELLPVFDNKDEAIEYFKTKQREKLIKGFESNLKHLNKLLDSLNVIDIDD